MTIGVAINFWGCAGSVTKVESIQELPKELPKEIQEKFEVRDSSTVTATPVLEPTQLKKKTRKKKGAAAKVLGKELASATEPFVYPMRRPAKDPIWISEEHVFEISYFGMAAGNFTLNVLPHKAIDNRKVYHVRGTAVSSKVFSLFYRLNDTIESFIDYEGLFSHRFHLVLDETKQSRDALELNDSEKKQTYYWNRWNHKENGYSETKEFQSIQPFSQDSLSAIFYLRTVPLDAGSVVTFPVVSEGKTWEAVVTVIRREIMDTPLGRVNCVVVKPETRFQGVAQNKGDSFLWFTDDDRRYIVRLEAKVRVGTVVAALKKVEPGTPPE